jgi:hypothetical protein
VSIQINHEQQGDVQISGQGDENPLSSIVHLNSNLKSVQSKRSLHPFAIHSQTAYVNDELSSMGYGDRSKHLSETSSLKPSSAFVRFFYKPFLFPIGLVSRYLLTGGLFSRT